METGRQGDKEIRGAVRCDQQSAFCPTSITTNCSSRCGFSFALDRRSFVQMLGAGVLVTAIGTSRWLGAAARHGRRRGGGFRGGPPPALSARIHFADDGTITVLSGKVDGGQGSRGELAQAAAEELRVPLEQVQRRARRHGHRARTTAATAGSRHDATTVPAVRQAAAAVRQLLVEHAAEKWDVDAAAVEVARRHDCHTASNRIVR